MPIVYVQYLRRRLQMKSELQMMTCWLSWKMATLRSEEPCECDMQQFAATCIKSCVLPSTRMRLLPQSGGATRCSPTAESPISSVMWPQWKPPHKTESAEAREVEHTLIFKGIMISTTLGRTRAVAPGRRDLR